MEENRTVKFRDVAENYFSQTRVDCRYTISSQHSWSSHDWIGLFKVGWLTVKDYYTFAWALAPEGYQTGTDANCSVAFYSSYLPKPEGEAYQFVYVDEHGEICAVSSQFTFCAPRPLDELVTLEQEKNGEEEEEGDDLLLVVPKALILQSLLEGCQRELHELHKRLEVADDEVERERERWKTDRDEFERVRKEMRSQIDELKDNLRQSTEKIEELEQKQKDVQSTHENMTAERSGLLAERAENHQRIKELKQDAATLTQQKQDIEAELDRMKERVKKMTTQRRDEEKEKKDLQIENEHSHAELQTLQERLEASERSADALRRDLSELGSMQSHSHAELHQVRLQSAQINLQLSQANLALREGQSTWAQERETLRQSAELDKDRVQKLSRELQKKEEWLQEERTEREKLEVELGNEKDCNRELRASLRALQKEQEQHQLEKQELLDHIHVLELRLDTETDAKWAEAAATPTYCIDRPPSIEEKPPQESLSVLDSEQFSSHGSTEQSQKDNENDMMAKDLEVKPYSSVIADKPSLLSEHKDSVFSGLTDAPLW
ncbi:calcium-binding and coiled-coil domain-containing protein 1b isoform X1 [Ctenopharyngodon idella]|uniref:calcium-binding and coiled-coil domain-containing protein 1b isoform X1 n=1 Tax=Ctenopharyngodon idella TaxID=7959 RepID=UPI002231529A|nr:calcium-binding and coiled-coil domain-containing protein 1b isoform X1 [Ctenopharyngodon idella]XP_051769338.1 calcium-binding and coiled-coil domain-containing protein 1b isoform X1 [Ctenopharyngodon idella]